MTFMIHSLNGMVHYKTMPVLFRLFVHSCNRRDLEALVANMSIRRFPLCNDSVFYFHQKSYEDASVYISQAQQGCMSE